MPGRAGFPEDDPEVHPGTEMEIQELEQEEKDTGRESFPETLQNKYSTAGARLRVKPNRPASDPPEGTFRGVKFDEGSGFTTGEPMDIALQLLKERKSPEAWANKKRYDSEYQKNPKRVKYREQLNAERRKRGIYGKGGKDVSHTQGGKLTLESAHANRARHFKNRGTLRRVKVR